MTERQPRRVTRQLTSAEQRLQQLHEQIAVDLPEMIARDQLRKEARMEATLSGDLRRAIHDSLLSLSAIAKQARIEPIMLDEFLTGERTYRFASDFGIRTCDCRGGVLAWGRGQSWTCRRVGFRMPVCQEQRSRGGGSIGKKGRRQVAAVQNPCGTAADRCAVFR